MFTFIKGESSDIYQDEMIHRVLQLQDVSRINKIFESEDVLFLFKVFQGLQEELKLIRLENEVYSNFLAKNDPVEFKKITREQPTVKATRRVTKSKAEREDDNRKRLSSISFLPRRSIKSNRDRSSSFTSSSSIDTSLKPTRLNTMVKNELTRKLINEVEERVEKQEKESKMIILNHKAQIFVLTLEIDDLHRSIESFEDTVVKNGERGRATTIMKIPTERFTNYCFNWIKNALEAISTTRDKTANIRRKSYQQSSELVKKRDQKTLLLPVDFEISQISRDMHARANEEQYMSLIGVMRRSISTKVSLAFQKQSLIAIEEKLSDIKRNITLTQKQVGKVEREIKVVENEIIDSNEGLMRTMKHMDEHKAPSIRDYMSLKGKLAALEKEEKQIQRRNSVLKMKINNGKNKLAKEQLKKAQK